MVKLREQADPHARRCSALLLFVALLVNVTYVQYVHAGDLKADPRNRRVIDAAFSRDRGPILVDREAIAESVPSDDRYEYQRVYTQPFKYAPSPASSPSSPRPASSRPRTPCSPATTPGCS